MPPHTQQDDYLLLQDCFINPLDGNTDSKSKKKCREVDNLETFFQKFWSKEIFVKEKMKHLKLLFTQLFFSYLFYSISFLWTPFGSTFHTKLSLIYELWKKKLFPRNLNNVSYCSYWFLIGKCNSLRQQAKYQYERNVGLSLVHSLTQADRQTIHISNVFN